MKDHAHYFAKRERQCRALAEAHADPSLRRIYEKFANQYARALEYNDGERTPPGVSARKHAAREPDYPVT
jgi:hypothetical protein